MISPLGQRQILQTASIETVKLAMEGGAQVQRELARRQAFDAKLADAMVEVPDVGESDMLKLSEHEGQRRDGSKEHGTGASGDDMEESPAEGAGPHLDLLA